MRRRLYFLLPDVAATQRVVKDLLLARIEERHIHVLARPGTDIGDLPEADIWQRSDLMHGMSLGLMVGGLTGAVVGTVALVFRPEALQLGFGAILGLALLGAVFGAWVAGLIGFDVPNTQLGKFWKDIGRGRVLLMVDVPRRRVGEISALIRHDSPGAKDEGTEPTMPVFP